METKNRTTKFNKSVDLESISGRTIINYRTERPTNDEYAINYGRLNIYERTDASFGLEVNFDGITSESLLKLAELFAEAAEELRKA